MLSSLLLVLWLSFSLFGSKVEHFNWPRDEWRKRESRCNARAESEIEVEPGYQNLGPLPTTAFTISRFFFLFLYVSVTALSFLSSFFGASFIFYFLVKKNLILPF